MTPLCQIILLSLTEATNCFLNIFFSSSRYFLHDKKFIVLKSLASSNFYMGMTILKCCRCGPACTPCVDLLSRNSQNLLYFWEKKSLNRILLILLCSHNQLRMLWRHRILKLRGPIQQVRLRILLRIIITKLFNLC